MKRIQKIADRADLGRVSFMSLELGPEDLGKTLKALCEELGDLSGSAFLNGVEGGLDLKLRAQACSRLEMSPKKARELVLARICDLLGSGDAQAATELQVKFKACEDDESLVKLAKGLA